MSEQAYATVQLQQKTSIGSSSKNTLLQRTCACGQHTPAGGKCEACSKKREGVLQRHAAISNEPTTVRPIVSEVLRSPGQPLDAGTRTFIEPRFGHDFSQVRIHSDAGAAPVSRSIVAQAFTPEREASEHVHGERMPPVNTNRSSHPLPFLDTIQRSFGHYDLSHVRVHTDSGAAAEARSIGAEAFARGSDVTFSRTPSLHTAAHEAAHVIQQRTGVEITGDMGREGDAYERHADEVADRVVCGQSSETLLDTQPGAGGPRPELVQGSMPTCHVAAFHPPVTQLRRIPPNVRALLTAAGGGKGANFFANEEGALRLIDLAMEELTPAERAKVKTRRLGGLTEAQFNALPRLERRSRYVEAILAEFPDLKLGDPNLIDTGPRPLTADAGNITKVVANADNVFNDIASGARDTWLTDVFGAGSVATAKMKYAKGRTSMNTLHASNHIVTDRSGYVGEVFQGGLTDPPGTPDQKIRVEPDVIDKPDDKDHVVLLMHESMHAGNSDVSDDVYNGEPGFQTQPEAKKLLNSAHFEVVPWRILKPKDARGFPVVPATTPPTFQVFIPAGTTVGGVTAAPRTEAEEGAIAAQNRLREAWTIGLNLHPLYLQVFRTPTDWTVPQPDFGGDRFDQALPFWSKVQKLTIHMKTIIDPASPDEAKHPVSQIDLALSEGLTHRLAFGMYVLHPLDTHAKILAFEAAHATASERASAFPGGAHTDADAERDFLLRLAVRDPKVAPMTGNVARDLRVVRELGLLNWGDVLNPRNPTSFPD